MSSAGRALAIVQARMSSTRLPGKTLAEINGEPMLLLLLRRLSHARRIARIVVATSTDASDEPIIGVAIGAGVEVSRGPQRGVLGRFLLAIDDLEDPIVRITADCPLTDPAVVAA